METFKIKDEDELLRRVPKVLSHYNKGRISSAVFKPKPGENGLSVDILSLTTIEISIKDISRYLAAVIIAKDVIKEGCECVHDPISENYSHALIKGITRQISKKLSVICKVIDLA